MTAGPNRIVRRVATGSAALGFERRLLAVRVLELTGELVALVARDDWCYVARVLIERRLLLERIADAPLPEDDRQCVSALRAAMAESDRTVGLLIANAEHRSREGY
jgi:hypothetical protein